LTFKEILGRRMKELGSSSFIEIVVLGIQLKIRVKPERERERERDRERERESGAVGATSTPSTVGLFSFLTMLFLPTFSQH
jgi:hypothetical protein